jgi:phosphoglucosamine mutase
MTIESEAVERLQGTDGIRRPVALAADPRVSGLTPQRAFLEKGLLTEEFFELYAYAYVSSLGKPGEVVVGWDPRDPAGDFTGAAVSGVRKAGATAVVLGIFPTPGVALYHIWRGSMCALMITASHNFRDQNGIKIFHGPHALKLFPDEDRDLTARVLSLDYARDVKPLAERGRRLDARDEAREVFLKFHLDPRNSWLKPGETFGDFPLVIDAANGAMSGLAFEVFRRLHGGAVTELNSDTQSGDVNRKSGVADLEGVQEIARGELRFAEHSAVQALFEKGGKAAVFDADGDRFYRLDHDRESGKILVLSGDETACHQARFLSPRPPSPLYVNTVESDLNAARFAQELGYEPVLTGVGDKWVLKQAAENAERYGIGSEETGHNISRGYVTTRAGRDLEVFLGNGLKSALNTFVATRGLKAREAARPFPRGFKKTFYVYYTRKELLRQGGDVFRGVEELIRRECVLGEVVAQPRPEEPDMLYLAVKGADGRQRAGIFVRNSGTEEKTGVNVRGTLEDSAELVRVGEEAILRVARAMKDREHPMARAERAILEALRGGPRASAALPVPAGVHRERLLEELANKEKVIRACAAGYELTPLGARMLEAWA